MILIGHIKTHNTKSRCGNPSNTYTKPPKFSVLSFRQVLVCNLTMVWVRPTPGLSIAIVCNDRVRAIATIAYLRPICLRRCISIGILGPNIIRKWLPTGYRSNTFLSPPINTYWLKRYVRDDIDGYLLLNVAGLQGDRSMPFAQFNRFARVSIDNYCL